MNFTEAIDKEKAIVWAGEIEKMQAGEFADLEQAWYKLPEDAADVAHRAGEKVLPSEYGALRKLLIGKGAPLLRKRQDYQCDVECGLALYAFLAGKKFTEVLAERDDFWRYVTLAVIPDLTYVRYPKEEKARIREKRFFGHTRRIWIKTLWWYVHLSWQGSEEATRQVLSAFGSDAISQLIERTGAAGYRVDVAREIMKCYYQERLIGRASAKLFNKAMARHLIYFDTMEPLFTSGGISGYVERLFEAAYRKVAI